MVFLGVPMFSHGFPQLFQASHQPRRRALENYALQTIGEKEDQATPSRGCLEVFKYLSGLPKSQQHLCNPW